MEYYWSQLPSSKLVCHCCNSYSIPSNSRSWSISSVCKGTTPRTIRGLTQCCSSQLPSQLATVHLLSPAKWPNHPVIIATVTGCVKCKFRKLEEDWFITSETWNGIQSLLKLSQKSLLFPWTVLLLSSQTSHHSSPAWKLQISATAIDSPSSLAGKLCSHTNMLWLSH